MVYLTSLLELSVVDVLTEQRWAVRIDTEPAFLALGPAHLATGMNNQVRPTHPLLTPQAEASEQD